ncbi:MAG: FAD-dependent monooxygenase [Phycisphaerales bacterium]|jgi:flavin-dependent dehydrogenase|nr:FAD-dependent monooxygenase [Phycisphaerales bacterium]
MDEACDVWPVVVIGAGPAGAVAALVAARAGARVLLIERCAWPRTKVCGSCLNPAGVRMLEAVGVRTNGAGLGRVRVCTPRRGGWRDGAGVHVAGFAHPGGVAIARDELDARLVEAGVQRGVQFWPGCSAKVLGCEGAVGGAGVWRLAVGSERSTREIAARCVIVADGLSGSSLSRVDAEGFAVRIAPDSWMGAGAVLSGEESVAWHAHVAAGEIAMHATDAGYVGLVRLADGRVDVAGAMDPRAVRAAGGPGVLMGEILRQCGVDAPADALTRVGAMMGTGLLTRSRGRHSAPGLLVAGDSAAYVEPFTGEGMTWAIAQGRAAGELAAVACGEGEAARRAWMTMPEAWSRVQRGGLSRRRATCGLVRWIARRGSMRRPAIVAIGASQMLRRVIEAIVRRASRPEAVVDRGATGGAPCAS